MLRKHQNLAYIRRCIQRWTCSQEDMKLIGRVRRQEAQMASQWQHRQTHPLAQLSRQYMDVPNTGALRIIIAWLCVGCRTVKKSYYTSGYFDAVCSRPGHGPSCKMSRRGALLATESGPTTTGRPLGFLMAWLMAGASAEDKAAHRAQHQFDVPLSVRIDARVALMEIEGGPALAERERPRRDDEPVEPLWSS